MGKYSTGNIVRVTPVWKFQGSDEQANVFHIKLAGSVSSTDADVEQDIEDWLLGLYDDISSNVMSGDVLHDRTEILIENSIYASTILPPNVGFDGEGGTDPCPPGLCGLVIARTAARHHIGKKYLPSFTEAALDNGAWHSSTVTEMQAFGDLWAMQPTMGGGLQVKPVIYPAGGGSSFEITSCVARSNPAYQRRRRKGRGS